MSKSNNPLHQVVWNNDIDQEEDIDQVTSDNSSVLHFALLYDHKNVVNYLLKQKLKVNRRNHLGQNELHFAARYGGENVVEFLIKQAMNVNEASIDQSTPLHYATLNSRCNKEAVVEKLLKYGAKVDVEDKNGNTVLNLICQLKSVSENAVEKLLEKGADPNHRNKNEVTPLFSSILNNQTAVAKLVEHGGNINQVNNNHDNALHIIMRHKVDCPCKRISFENSLIKFGAKINGVNKDNQTPLLACLEYDDFYHGLVEIENLIEKGAQMSKNKDGESVHLSIKKYMIRLVEYFWEKGADIHDITSNRSSVLHYAAQYTKDKKIIELLLNKSNNTRLVHSAEKEGRTPLHIAALLGSNELIEVF